MQNPVGRYLCRLPHLNFTITLLPTYNSYSILEAKVRRNGVMVPKSLLLMVGARV